MQKELDAHLLVTRLAHVPRLPSEGPLREVLRDFGSLRSGSNKNNRLTPRKHGPDLPRLRLVSRKHPLIADILVAYDARIEQLDEAEAGLKEKKGQCSNDEVSFVD